MCWAIVRKCWGENTRLLRTSVKQLCFLSAPELWDSVVSFLPVWRLTKANRAEDQRSTSWPLMCAGLCYCSEDSCLTAVINPPATTHPNMYLYCSSSLAQVSCYLERQKKIHTLCSFPIIIQKSLIIHFVGSTKDVGKKSRTLVETTTNNTGELMIDS